MIKNMVIQVFIQKYLSDFYYDLLLDKYEYDYISSLDEINFVKIYNLFIENNFYFMEEIIVKFLEIFTIPYDIVKEKLGKCLHQLFIVSKVEYVSDGNDVSVVKSNDEKCDRC